jgi:hypothetical protein
VRLDLQSVRPSIDAFRQSVVPPSIGQPGVQRTVAVSSQVQVRAAAVSHASGQDIGAAAIQPCGPQQKSPVLALGMNAQPSDATPQQRHSGRPLPKQ